MDKFNDSVEDSVEIDYYTSAGDKYKANMYSFNVDKFLEEDENVVPFESPKSIPRKSKCVTKKEKESELNKNSKKSERTNVATDILELRPPVIGESIDLTLDDNVDSCTRRVTRSRRGRKRGSNSPVSRVQEEPTLILDSPVLNGSSDSSAPNASKGKKTRASKTKRGRASKAKKNSVQVLGSPIRIGSPDISEEINQDACIFVGSERLNLDIETPNNENVNVEMSVKVWWKFNKFDKFNIRKYQKLAILFEHYSKQDNVPQSQILLTLNDVPIHPNDTPDSLKLTIGDVLEGGVTTCENSAPSINIQQETVLGENEIELKVQRKNCKEPMLIRLSKEEPMKVFMLKCAENLELPLEKLKFSFDGDVLNPNETPVDLDLEGGECIDLNVLD